MQRKKTKLLKVAILCSYLTAQSLAFAGSDTGGTGTGGSGSGHSALSDILDAISWQVFPVPVLSQDKGRMITRQAGDEEEPGDGPIGKEPGDEDQFSQVSQSSQNPLSPIQEELEEENGSGPVVLDGSGCNNIHRVQDYNNGASGLGAIARFGLEAAKPASMLSGLGIAAGIIPLYGRGVRTDRTAASYEESLNMHGIAIPEKSDDINPWNIGDSVTFSSKGGLIVMGGVHFTGLTAGVMGTYFGQWKHTIKKIDHNKVKVTISKAKLKSLAMKAGIILFANVSSSKSSSFEKDITITLDLNDEEAKAAFRKLLKGDLTEAQKVANKAKTNGSESVVLSQEHSDFKKTSSKSAHIGIPIFLSKDKAQSKSRSFEKTIDHKEGEESLETKVKLTSDTTSSSFKGTRNFFKKDNWNNRFFQHINYNKVASGASFETTQKDSSEVVDKGQYAEVLWSYKNDNGYKGEAQKALKKIQEDTGLGDRLAVEFPKTDNGELGYVGIEYKVNITKGGVDELLTKLSENQYALANAGDAMVNDYLSKGDQRQLCTNKKGVVSEKCVAKLRENVGQKLSQIAVKLNELKNPKRRDGSKSQLMTEVAKIMQSSPFVLQAVVSLSNKIFAKYTVEGEKFVPHEVYIENM